MDRPKTIKEKGSGHSGEAGFTLLEILLAVAVLCLAIVPLADAFRPSLFSTVNEESQAVFANQARQTMNRILSLDFAKLWNNQADPVDINVLFNASDETFTFQDRSYTPVVSIKDASAGAGGLVEVTVSTGSVILKGLKGAQ